MTDGLSLLAVDVWVSLIYASAAACFSGPAACRDTGTRSSALWSSSPTGSSGEWSGDTGGGEKKAVRDNQEVGVKPLLASELGAGGRVCVTPPKPRANREHTTPIKKGLFRELGPLNYTSNNSSEEKSRPCLFQAAGITHGHQLLQSPLGNGAAGVLVWDIFRFNSRLLNMRRKAPEQMVEF